VEHLQPLVQIQYLALLRLPVVEMVETAILIMVLLEVLVVVVKLVARVTRHRLAHLREMQVAIALLVAITVAEAAVVLEQLALTEQLQTVVMAAQVQHQALLALA
jgi:hypothetical protein